MNTYDCNVNFCSETLGIPVSKVYQTTVRSHHPREAAIQAVHEAVEKMDGGNYFFHVLVHANVTVKHDSKDHLYVVSAELKIRYHAREVDESPEFNVGATEPRHT